MKKTMKFIFICLFLLLLTFAASAYDSASFPVPDTGDKTYIFIIAAAVALAGLIFVMIWRSKKNNSDDE